MGVMAEPRTELTVGTARIELVQGNIVDQEVDAIVNAANTKLKGGGGVDGAIHRAAGPDLLTACREFPANEKDQRCQTGEVRTTPGFNLPANYCIHAVGPWYNEKYAEKNSAQLRSVHQLALEAAVERNCESVAFPAISTGAYRFPIRAAAEIALTTARDFLQQPGCLQLVRFVLYKQNALTVFSEVLGELAEN